MMNNDSGWTLMDEITNSVPDPYGRPQYEPMGKEVVDIDSSSFICFSGQYRSDEDELEISVIDSKLFVDFKNGLGALRLFPSGKCAFFIQQDDITVEFLGCEGKSNRLALIDSKVVKTVFSKK